jgi:amino acid transporter
MPWAAIDADYPLVQVVRHVLAGRAPLVLWGFAVVALFGLVASYHGLLYGTSRQAFALGRDGYLPGVLGRLHARRQVPVAALAACSVVAAGFVVANVWYGQAIQLTILVAGLASLIWYILAMVCLVVLRRREPGLFHGYRAPLGRTLPMAVVLLSAVALYAYVHIAEAGVVLPLTAGLYTLGMGYYLLWARMRVARRGHEAEVVAPGQPALPPRSRGLEWAAAGALAAAVVAALGAMWASREPDRLTLASAEVELVLFLALVAAALVLLGAVVLLRDRRGAGSNAVTDDAPAQGTTRLG